MPRRTAAKGKLPTIDGTAQCHVCQHPACDVFDQLILKGIVVYDGAEYTTAEDLIHYVEAKYPNEIPVKKWNVSRHRAHVNKSAITDTQLVLRSDGKLYRRELDGTMAEVPKFGATEGLSLIVSIGLDQILKGKSRIGAKTVVEAIELLHKIQATSAPADEYDALVAQRHRGESSEDPLSQIEIVDIPPDVLSGLRSASDDEEDGDG